MSITVVITTYNRKELVTRAIDSVLDEFKRFSGIEVIIVDDFSHDDTVDYLKSSYEDEIENNLIKIISNSVNRGVSASKNTGFRYAKNQWVFFLDSDDYLLSESGCKIVNQVSQYEDVPIIFFRCLDNNGNVVGHYFSDNIQIDLITYLENVSYGEALTAINKNLVQGSPYIDELRGYEGLGCTRIIANHGAAILSCVIARGYDQSGDDRLSVRSSMLRRMPLLARGHLLMLKEFWPMMSLNRKTSYLAKVIIYLVIGGIYRLLSTGK